MKKQFVEFLIKRMESKVAYLDDAASHEEIVSIAEDIGTYLSTLKDVLKEVLLP